MNAGEVLILNLKIIIATMICFEKFREDNVDFCSCDHPYEDRSLSTFSFIEAFVLCSMRCLQTASCVAYNFFNATNQCQLFNQTLNKFSVPPGCQYYLKKGGLLAGTPLNTSRPIRVGSALRNIMTAGTKLILIIQLGLRDSLERDRAILIL
ncbi:hypothetical protein HELRODRAFT_171915 [Helobdella robusta]|uniref:Apple domain-containing protein n=1 Tax=Helobdella robusta TaxID=6412 RepID=T1F4U6_HELRO|nr:hypothetical protein HELRODRAFT_171915 [Helobdella robusta]ESO04913.1 hypothetical protein HELRODRAFT_171915 [Helobdella robusta]